MSRPRALVRRRCGRSRYRHCPRGYAAKLPDEWLEKERESQARRIDSDIVITAARFQATGSGNCTEEMVGMRPGSAIVDKDRPGGTEITEPGQITRSMASALMEQRIFRMCDRFYVDVCKQHIPLHRESRKTVRST